MAWALAAHAVVVQQLGPLALKNIDTYPAAMLLIIFVMKNGDRRPGPFSARMCTVLTYVSIPPIPEPMMVPVSGESSSVISSPESSSASLAEATAYWMNASVFLASFGFM